MNLTTPNINVTAPKITLTAIRKAKFSFLAVASVLLLALLSQHLQPPPKLLTTPLCYIRMKRKLLISSAVIFLLITAIAFINTIMAKTPQQPYKELGKKDELEFRYYPASAFRKSPSATQNFISALPKFASFRTNFPSAFPNLISARTNFLSARRNCCSPSSNFHFFLSVLGSTSRPCSKLMTKPLSASSSQFFNKNQSF